MNDSPCKGEKLALTGGEVVAALTDHFLEPAVKLADEAVRIHIAAGFPDLVIREIVTQNDIAADGAGEEENVLQHLAEMAAQRGDLDMADVDAVDQDLSLLDVVVADN